VAAQGTTGSGPSTLLLAGIFAVIGVLIALLLAFTGVFNGGTASATASPGASGAPTLAPSLVAGASPSAAPSIDVLPTAAPSDAPTSGPVSPTAAPATPKPSPTPNTNPRIVSWEVPKYEDCTGSTAGSIDVSWEVRRATGVTVSIDGPGIYNSYGPSSDPISIPFGCDYNVLKHTYTLTTTGGTGPAASITRTVTARPPSIVSFSMGLPDCGPGDTFVGISMSFEIRAATGAELRRDGALYSTYSTKATDDIILFDCSKNFQEFTLKTTGGYGQEASKKVTVLHN
jgi:hypothetical protein